MTTYFFILFFVFQEKQMHQFSQVYLY